MRGLRFRHNNGSMQIDGESPNLALTRSFEIPFTWSQRSVRVAEVWVHRDDVFVYRPPEGERVKPQTLYQAGSEWQKFTFHSEPDHWPPPIRAWTYRRVDRIGNPARAGFVIRNPRTGATVFNSAYRYMSVLEYFSPTSQGDVEFRQDGRVLACAMMGDTKGGNSSTADNGFSGSFATATWGGGLKITNRTPYNGDLNLGLSSHPFLIVDVTGH